MSASKQLTLDTNFSNWMLFNFPAWVVAALFSISSFNDFLVILPFVLIINWISWLFLRRFKQLQFDEKGVFTNEKVIPYECIQKVTETGWSLARHGRQRIYTLHFALSSTNERMLFIPDEKELNDFLMRAQLLNPSIQIRTKK